MTPPRTQQQILLSGEDDTDVEAIKALVRGLRPDLECKFKKFRVSPTLVRGMRPETARPRHQKILAEIRAANVAMPVRATLLHEDADDVESAHLTLIAEKEAPLSTAPGTVVAVVPAWEIETWWLMFPDSVKAQNASWNRPDKYAGRTVGGVRNSKEELKRLVKQGLPAHPRVRDYHENDSPAIARHIVSSGSLLAPIASSNSWTTFVAKIAAL